VFSTYVGGLNAAVTDAAITKDGRILVAGIGQLPPVSTPPSPSFPAGSGFLAMYAPGPTPPQVKADVIPRLGQVGRISGTHLWDQDVHGTEDWTAPIGGDLPTEFRGFSITLGGVSAPIVAARMEGSEQVLYFQGPHSWLPAVVEFKRDGTSSYWQDPGYLAPTTFLTDHSGNARFFRQRWD